MPPELDCHSQASFPTIAGYFSSLTGLLAGFAFTALTMLLTPTQNDERKSEGRASNNGSLLTIFVTLVALIISSLNFSVIAGESVLNGRVATQELMVCIPFGLSVIMIFHGVGLLLRESGVDRVAVWIAQLVTVVMAPVMAMVFAGTEITQTETLRIEEITKTCMQAPAPIPTLILQFTGVLAMTLALALFLVPRLQPRIIRFWARKFRNVVPITVLAVSGADGIATAILTTSPPGILLPPSFVKVYIIGFFALHLTLGLMFSFIYSDSQEPGDYLVDG